MENSDIQKLKDGVKYRMLKKKTTGPDKNAMKQPSHKNLLSIK